MKVIFIFAIFVSVALCYPTSVADPMPEIEPVPEKALIDFLNGLLDGFGIKEDIEKLKKCLQIYSEFQKFIQQLQEALEHLKNMNFNDLKIGIELLFKAVSGLFAAISPCLQAGSMIKKLITMITSANIVKIVLSILSHPIGFTKDVVNAISCLSKGDYYCAGHAVGDILRIVLL